MKINVVEALRDRATASVILDPADPRFETGSAEDRAKARAEWRRARFVHQVVNSGLQEIPRSRLQPLRGARLLEDTETGSFYVERRDGLIDLEYVPDAVGYYSDSTGLPILLEHPSSGAKSRAEMEQLQAKREQRRNAAKPRRQAKRR